MRRGEPNHGSAPRLTDDDVRQVRFGKPPFGRRGYDDEEVDTFLDLLAETLSGRPGASRLTAADVHNVAFRKPPIGKRGYDEDEVDSFLDLAERELLRRDDVIPPTPQGRSGGGPGSPGMSGAAGMTGSHGIPPAHTPAAPMGMAPPSPPPMSPPLPQSPPLPAPPPPPPPRSASPPRSQGLPPRGQPASAPVPAPRGMAPRPMDSAAVVHAIWQRTQARDWHGVAELIEPGFVCEWPESHERFMGREAWITMNVNYPSDWHITVDEVVAQGESAASRVRVTDENGIFHAASFWMIRDGRAARLTEYYVREGSASPAAWRAAWAQRY